MYRTFLSEADTLDAPAGLRTGNGLDKERRDVRDTDTLVLHYNWPGDPAALEEVVLSRIDWGPFEVRCHQASDRPGEFTCAVQYSGPSGEKDHLMASARDKMKGFRP